MINVPWVFNTLWYIIKAWIEPRYVCLLQLQLQHPFILSILFYYFSHASYLIFLFYYHRKKLIQVCLNPEFLIISNFYTSIFNSSTVCLYSTLQKVSMSGADYLPVLEKDIPLSSIPKVSHLLFRLIFYLLAAL